MKMHEHSPTPSEVLSAGLPIYFRIGNSSKEVLEEQGVDSIQKEYPEEYAWVPKGDYVHCFHFQKGQGGTMVKRKKDKALVELALIMNTHPGIKNAEASLRFETQSTDDETDNQISS